MNSKLLQALGISLLALALAPVAEGTLVLRHPDGAPVDRYQAWVDAARVKTPKTVINLLLRDDGCDKISGACAFPSRALVIMYTGYDWYTRVEWLHEVGHIYSFRNRHYVRALYTRVFQERYDEELFAMGYSWCAISPWTPPRKLRGYGYAPSVNEHRALCAALLPV